VAAWYASPGELRIDKTLGRFPGTVGSFIKNKAPFGERAGGGACVESLLPRAGNRREPRDHRRAKTKNDVPLARPRGARAARARRRLHATGHTADGVLLRLHRRADDGADDADDDTHGVERPDARGDLRPDAHDRSAVVRADDGHVRAVGRADGHRGPDALELHTT